MGADSVMHCIDHAVHVGATPDGRFAKAMFSKNMCSVSGMDREGVTAAMLSVLRIDTSDLLNAAVFDFIIHPSAVEGERGMDALMALTKVYFEMGGMVLQGNIFNADDLKAAQNHPEQYANLQVRVCGWNEYFVKMTKQKQDDFIKRCQNVN
jgi:formate C-acetyltransferase